jgi:hypothetical protein
MKEEGPPLNSLTRRLAECPPEFLAEPRIGSAGAVHVAAVVADVLRALGGSPLTAAQAAHFTTKDAKAQRNRLSIVLIACWLLADPWFQQQKRFGSSAYQFLSDGLLELAQLNKAPSFVNDPDRREELVRMMLNQLELRPQGETIAQAQDRLMTLSTAERQRVVRAARAAEERARAIRAAMAEQAAREAADKMSRE